MCPNNRHNCDILDSNNRSAFFLYRPTLTCKCSICWQYKHYLWKSILALFNEIVSLSFLISSNDLLYPFNHLRWDSCIHLPSLQSSKFLQTLSETCTHWLLNTVSSFCTVPWWLWEPSGLVRQKQAHILFFVNSLKTWMLKQSFLRNATFTILLTATVQYIVCSRCVVHQLST